MQCIAPIFAPVHNSIVRENCTHFWLKGGRGSTKSSFISLEIVAGIMAHPGTHAKVFRRVKDTLRTTVFPQLQWAINLLGVKGYWKATYSPLKLTYLPTGQEISFSGLDDPTKTKSTKMADGYTRYIWFEELNEFDGMEQIRTVQQSLVRENGVYTIFYSYNPPKSVANWVNAEAQEDRPDRMVHHSTYLEVPRIWLGEQFFIEAEHLKNTKATAYEHEYMGVITGTGGAIFDNLTLRHISDAEIKEFDNHRRGLDWGYSTDPTHYGAMQYDKKHKKLYIYYEFNQVAASYDQIYDGITIENVINGEIICDSSEPRSIYELSNRGLKARPCVKGAGSIEHGIKYLQDMEEIIIDPVRCPNTAREFGNYEYERDRNGNFKGEYPDKDNHSIDMTRYALNNDMRYDIPKKADTRTAIQKDKERLERKSRKKRW